MNNKENLVVSFSGGQTSGFMTKKILDKYSDRYNITVVFANTGQENEATLEFVNNCDKYFNFNTIWVEAVVHQGIRKQNTHRIVTFETASRNGEPFEKDIQKYGIPNASSPHCSRNLKRYPIESYIKSLGLKQKDFTTAIGIRTDESRRVSKETNRRVVYPLIEWFPSDKQDVVDWWEEQPFNLELKNYQGNCKTCWKKSSNKLKTIYQENPEHFKFFELCEEKYPRVGPEFQKRPDAPNRVFNRKYIPIKLLKEQWESGYRLPNKENLSQEYEDAGCSESCEIFETH